MASPTRQSRQPTADEFGSELLPLLLRRFAVSTRARVTLGAAELVLVTVLFVAVWFDDQAMAWIGVPAAIATAAVMAVGILAGAPTGLSCGLASAVVFLPLVAFDQPVTPVLWGVPIVVVWAACGFLAGYAADRLRSAAADSFAALVEQRDAQRQVATTLRRALRPERLPAIPGVEIADLYRPAEQNVGGDFYAVWPIAGRDPAFGFAIGDVQGKGVEAAAVTALARHTIRATSLAGNQPAETLRLLNEALDPTSQRFVTALSAFLCPKPSHVEVTVSAAGHPAPIIRRSDGTPDHLDAVHGTLLGAYPVVDVHDVEFRLQLGEVLVCYTDGLTDAASDQHDERFGIQRLSQAILDAREPTAASVVLAITDALERFGHTRHSDDIALLAITPAP